MAIYCSCCHDEIKSQYELVVVPSFFRLYPYHTQCYGLLVKGSDFWNFGAPVNSKRGTFLPFFVTSLYLFNLLNQNFRAEPFLHFIWAFIIIYPTYLRLYSYYKFEKKL